jgi:hypothetical protein
MALQPFPLCCLQLNGEREGVGVPSKERDRDRETRLLRVRDSRLLDERQERQGRGTDER